MPCRPGLRDHSVCIVFSAPEITTVSKPKRNPASADVSDQKKIRAFMSWCRVLQTTRTENRELRTENREPRTASSLRQRISLPPPVANAAIHRDNVLVTHLLQIVGGEGGAESTAAVKNDFCIQIRYTRLDIALDDALPEMNRARQVVRSEFALF